jgi:hypothetical protein
MSEGSIVVVRPPWGRTPLFWIHWEVPDDDVEYGSVVEATKLLPSFEWLPLPQLPRQR